MMTLLSGKDLINSIRLCRKYHNEARYSNISKSDLYDLEFASRFIGIVSDVREYIDNECIATLDDLHNKYGK